METKNVEIFFFSFSFSLSLYLFLSILSLNQVDECENLPKNMCDSCIIQLNVAYNLKKNAIQSDMKLRQYMIEFGINVTSYTTCSINTVSVIRPPAMLMPATTTSESVTITAAKSTTVGPAPQVQVQTQPLRPFPVMPVIIKEEPIDYEVMSDITVETNTEAFEERLRNQRNGRNGRNGIHSTASTSSSSNKSLTPLPVHSMVSVNGKSLLISSQHSTDSEYISAYMQSSNRDPSTNGTTTVSVTKQKPGNTISVAVAKSKSKSKSPQSSPTTKSPPSPIKTTKKRTRTGELGRLKDDSTIQSNTPEITLQGRRQTRQQIKVIKIETEPNTQRSRSRNGTQKLVDYKSFFTARVASPTTNGTTNKLKRRMSVDASINRPNRKIRSPNNKNHNKSKHQTVTPKRRNSISHNRTRII